jgi:CTP:molybdopterin cytidylyltransferase MocA
MNKEIACIILAAGEGRRFGVPKWQAQYKGTTFLEMIAEKVVSAGISDTGCVIRKNSIPNTKGIQYAINPNPEWGMFSSLYYGVNLFPKKSGFLIIPVDHPFFKCETLTKLCALFMTLKIGKVVKPVYSQDSSCYAEGCVQNEAKNNNPTAQKRLESACKCRSGHPIIIPGSLAKNIPIGDYKGGLKKFIEDKNVPIHNIYIDDRGVLKNINTLADIP